MRVGALIRGLLGIALVFGAVWLVAILYWRASGATPGTPQIVGTLLLLPLLLVAGVLLLRALMRRRSAGRERTATDPIAGSTMAQDAAEQVEADRIFYLLGSAALTRAGSGGEVLAGALLQPQRPSLHPSLRDQMGLPVFAAQVDDLDVESVRAAVDGLLPESGPRSQGFAEDQLRALALLEPVAEDLLYAALPFADVDPVAAPSADTAMHPHAMQHSRSSRALAPAPQAPVLHIRLLLPAHWPEPVRRACLGWIADKATAIGFASGTFRIGVEPVAGVADAWRVIDRLAQPDAHADAAPSDTHLLLAAHSLMDELAVSRLDATRSLLVSGHPEGLIPGEGAAGVWLSTQTPGDGREAPPLRLHRVVHGPAGHGRTAGRELASLLQRALAVASLPADDVAAVFSDADHRPSRAIEIAGAMTACLPELDPVEQGRHLGLVCGETGAVAVLALLAAAAAQATAEDAPVVLASVADDTLRFAAALSPMPSPEPPAAPAAETV
ncbi:hypothetical protein INQ41_00525 [Lysobacter ciconiae]|uniref:Transmembrane protein n=1 Tax=Novilysobacter ciconiae TaxID=2781022 RepID=A0A7S6UG33_9GAMM|nr:hypothetical protein [Lysobacter ciconiae]QOW19620.1 hypothetical protein INQ41_00525 [Lysobacter ciconiae]